MRRLAWPPAQRLVPLLFVLATAVATPRATRLP